MFQRRTPKSFNKKILSFLWPENGWKRFGKYVLLKLARLKGSPHDIAIGFACGVAISFTPLVGGHLILAAVTAFLLGGNVLASAIGTFIGNPWSFPIIWVSILKTGEWFFGVHGNINSEGFVAMFADAMKALLSWNIEKFVAETWPVFKLMLIGCIPYYIISFLISYFIIKVLVLRVEKARQKRKHKKMLREIAK